MFFFYKLKIDGRRCNVGSSFYSHSIFGFHICWVKNKRHLFKKLVRTSTSHDSGSTSRKRTYLSLGWLCICGLVYQLNVWSSGQHLMRPRGGHSWDTPGLIWGKNKQTNKKNPPSCSIPNKHLIFVQNTIYEVYLL